jgi:16S rRNA (uracil1498-N3)-methyltransferase
MPRFYCPAPLVTDSSLDLPAGAARHVQVLRLQPGDAITLFNGGFGDSEGAEQGLGPTGEFSATITHMGRSSVQVQVGPYAAVERESASSVHLAIGMPANERMDWLVEKATELGVASIQPLMTERSVLRLSGERADKKVAHWHSVAIAACEQCGGNRVPRVFPVKTLPAWLQTLATPATDTRWLLSLCEGSAPLQQHLVHATPANTLFLSGPEGGLSPGEEAAAGSSRFYTGHAGAAHSARRNRSTGRTGAIGAVAPCPRFTSPASGFVRV